MCALPPPFASPRRDTFAEPNQVKTRAPGWISRGTSGNEFGRAIAWPCPMGSFATGYRWSVTWLDPIGLFEIRWLLRKFSYNMLLSMCSNSWLSCTSGTCNVDRGTKSGRVTWYETYCRRRTIFLLRAAAFRRGTSLFCFALDVFVMSSSQTLFFFFWLGLELCMDVVFLFLKRDGKVYFKD
jgi:hypothetical protein